MFQRSSANCRFVLPMSIVVAITTVISAFFVLLLKKRRAVTPHDAEIAVRGAVNKNIRKGIKVDVATFPTSNGLPLAPTLATRQADEVKAPYLADTLYTLIRNALFRALGWDPDKNLQLNTRADVPVRIVHARSKKLRKENASLLGGILNR
jgi:hypothetical protein